MKKISLFLTAGMLGLGAVAGLFKALAFPRRKEKAEEKKKEEEGGVKETVSGSCDGL
ncbi:MAG: hypothetical protein M0Z60_14180 [Nitrospiraceae bacterium]|nr:hypothetical protein [Nitrospiraceae bacterium]